MEKNKQIRLVPIHTEFIKLEQFLKLTGEAPTGGAAKQAIQEGAVQVNGAVCTERGRKLRRGDLVAFEGLRWQVAQIRVVTPEDPDGGHAH